MNTEEDRARTGSPVAGSDVGVGGEGRGNGAHHPGRPDVVVIGCHDHGRHYGWDRRPVTVVREKTVIYRDWGAAAAGGGVSLCAAVLRSRRTIDVSPVFIPFR